MVIRRFDSVARLRGTPRRSYYRGRNLARVRGIEDLRARTHKRMPRLVLEYLEGGAGSEATLDRERQAFAEWRFLPRTLVDESHRTSACDLLGGHAEMPLAIAPTGLNGLFRDRADMMLAQGAARFGVPFIQSTMSNDAMEDVAKVPGLRHWWQLYVFGGAEIWQELLRRAAAAGCEALVLTTNSQIFGDRGWSERTRTASGAPTLASMLDAACHPRWMLETLRRGLPSFANVIDFIPKQSRGFFESADWIRSQMPRDLSWSDVARIRAQWKRPMLLKGLLNLDDVRRAQDSGIDGIILGSHGGRQMDWAVSALDILAPARKIVGDRMALYMSGGIRHGTDILKALALGADAVLTGRATLYGLCAAGAEGVQCALQTLQRQMLNELAQLGVQSLGALSADVMVRRENLPVGIARR